MACQKVCKQGRDESKVTVFAKAHPYIFFTVQLDSAWESSKVHQLLYWQFMAVALYSSHFLLQHGLGMKLAVCLVGNYWVSIRYIYQVAHSGTLGGIMLYRTALLESYL